MTNTELEYLLSNGLTESTEEDIACYDELMSLSLPFTALWEDSDNEVKCFQWDSDWEKYLNHRAELIDYEGRREYLPWNLYKNLNLTWLDGYAKAQGTGDCCAFGHFNSGKASNLTNAHRTGRVPKEFALSVAYAVARGGGKLSHGSGCNLNPMSKWAATVGNYWTSDFGKYDVGKYLSKYKKGSQQDANALKTQSVIIYLPQATFDHCYAVCAAGFGINMGSSVYPTASVPNGDGLATSSLWKNGAHSMALMASYIGQSGKRYIYLENSHGARYAADALNKERQWGCWLDESHFKRLAESGFRFGTWYAHLVEMGE